MVWKIEPSAMAGASPITLTLDWVTASVIWLFTAVGKLMVILLNHCEGCTAIAWTRRVRLR
ncbi:hypothetical protein ACSER9_11405 [Pseudomonas aeruginosa]|nr:hypothetical protein [Pseudomonas aeruginosa]